METAVHPTVLCSRCVRRIAFRHAARSFSTQISRKDAASTETSVNGPAIDPTTVLARNTTRPAQSRDEFARTRRRRVLQEQLGENSLKFEEMPFQCFQEARKFLLEDRKEKLQQIQTQRERMARIEAQEVAPQDEGSKKLRLMSMRKRLEELKLHADINDPLIKKRFEDGNGDMSKPIYRYLADRKWREYERMIVEQRITQMNVVPDVLPTIDLTVATQLRFNGHSRRLRRMEHGEILPSIDTENAPKMTIQPFDRGTRLVTIAVVNPDVPDVASDGFASRCHFLAVNVPISPTTTQVDLANLDGNTQLVQPWWPAYAQKGLPYQRMAVIVLEQPVREEADAEPHAPRSRELDASELKNNAKYGARDGFSLRALQTRYRLLPVGADLYRTVWDEGTAGVMERAGVTGADVEFKRKKIEPLPYKRLAEARYR